MLTGHYVFRQVMDYLPLQVFGRCVKRYQGNRKVREFSCLDQFQCMAFAATDSVGELDAYNLRFSGSATGMRYYVNTNSVIDATGQGISFFPGNSAGTTLAGGNIALD